MRILVLVLPFYVYIFFVDLEYPEMVSLSYGLLLVDFDIFIVPVLLISFPSCSL